MACSQLLGALIIHVGLEAFFSWKLLTEYTTSTTCFGWMAALVLPSGAPSSVETLREIAKSPKLELVQKVRETRIWLSSGEGPYRRAESLTYIFSIYFAFQAILSKKYFFEN